MAKVLRKTFLKITFDNLKTPQIDTPVGDFFGAAPGINPYSSLPFTVKPDGTMICRLIMPYQKNARFKFINHSDSTVSIQGAILPGAFSWRPETALYLHAHWRVDHGLKASQAKVIDIPFLAASGKGIYIGTSVSLLNPNPIPTSYGNWWGEGDEKIFIDQETFPSIFGTGSEDYFNYSWSIPDIFSTMYSGQPRNDGPGNRGFVSNFRWHILDPIPYNKRIQFTMELASHVPTTDITYARISYHYAHPKTKIDTPPIVPEHVEPPSLKKPWQPLAEKGAAEAHFYAAEKLLAWKDRIRLQRLQRQQRKKAPMNVRSKKPPQLQLREGQIWQDGRVLIWTPKTIGEQKDLHFILKKEGPIYLRLTLALTPASGHLSVRIDQKPLPLATMDPRAIAKPIINLFRPHRILSRTFTSSMLELKRGRHTLTLRYEGADADIERPEIGIDFIWTQPAHQH